MTVEDGVWGSVLLLIGCIIPTALWLNSRRDEVPGALARAYERLRGAVLLVPRAALGFTFVIVPSFVGYVVEAVRRRWDVLRGRG